MVRYFFKQRHDLPPHCDLPCSRVPDPRRHMGRIIINQRMFCWFCCPSHDCCQIWEVPTVTQVEEWKVVQEMAAIELLSQILKGQRPWKDLGEVVRLMPKPKNF